MSMASGVMKLIYAVLDVSFYSGHCAVDIKRQLLFINSSLLADLSRPIAGCFAGIG